MRPICSVTAVILALLAAPDAGAGRTPRSIQAATWTSLPSMPEARAHHAAIYDPIGQRMIVFGGQNDDPPASWDDTWALDLAGATGWAVLAATGERPEPGYHAAIYDPVRHRMLVLSGTEITWQLTLAGTPAWSRLTTAGIPPPGVDLNRQQHAHNGEAIYDPLRDRMVVITGGPGEPAHAWELTLGGTPTWSHLSPSGTAPTNWSNPVYDPARDVVVMVETLIYPGDEASVPMLHLDPLRWEILPATGSLNERHYSSMVHAPFADAMLLWGGHGHTRFFDVDYDDLWMLQLAASPPHWNRLEQTGTIPGRRSAHAAIWDAPRQRMILSGGATVNSGTFTPLNDVWALTVTEIPTAIAMALESATATQDAVHLVWRATEAVSARLERHVAGQGWREVATLAAEDGGRLRYADADVRAGARYGYRLVFGPAAERSAETWVDVPRATTFALIGFRPHPAAGTPVVAFSLARAGTATLELFDPSGRRVLEQRIEAGPGEHRLRLEGASGLPAGIYRLRLGQGEASVTRTAVIVR